MRNTLGVSLGLLLGAASVAGAQAVPHRFSVGPRLGWVQYEEVSGIDRSPLVGADAAYMLTSNLGIGVSLELSRAQTDGRYFPVEFSFGDTTFIFRSTYPITVLQYSAMAVGTVTWGRINPYVSVGLGQYRLFIDPQAARSPKTVTHGLFTLGGGVSVRLGETTGLRLEIRDFIYRSYDLNEVNTVEGRFFPTRFPDVAPVPDRSCYDAQCTLHNIQFALGFSFVPGGRP